MTEDLEHCAVASGYENHDRILLPADEIPRRTARAPRLTLFHIRFHHGSFAGMPAP